MRYPYDVPVTKKLLNQNQLKRREAFSTSTQNYKIKYAPDKTETPHPQNPIFTLLPNCEQTKTK